MGFKACLSHDVVERLSRLISRDYHHFYVGMTMVSFVSR